MIGGFETLIVGAVSAIAVIIGIYWKAWKAGKASAENRQMVDRLNAIRTADEIEQAVAGNDPASNRKEVAKWAKR